MQQGYVVGCFVEDNGFQQRFHVIAFLYFKPLCRRSAPSFRAAGADARYRSQLKSASIDDAEADEIG